MQRLKNRRRLGFLLCAILASVLAIFLTVGDNLQAQTPVPGSTSRTRIGRIRVRPRPQVAASAQGAGENVGSTRRISNVDPPCYSGIFDSNAGSASAWGFDPFEGVLLAIPSKNGDVFISIQADGDGQVTIDDFSQIYEATGLTAHDLTDLMFIEQDGLVRGNCADLLPDIPASLYQQYFDGSGFEPIFYMITAVIAPSWEGAIEFGSWNENTLARDHGDLWNFYGDRGQVVSISVGSGAFDTVIQLQNSNGEWLTQDDDGGLGLDSTIAYFELPYSGEYRLLVNSFDGASSGTYWVGLGWPSDMAREAGYLGYGDVQEGYLETTAGDRWWFEGRAGDIVSITVYGMDEFDPMVELYAGDRNYQFERNDDFGDSLNAAIVDFELPSTGAYRIIVRGYADTYGPYAVELYRR
ncbi:MAG: hypothetical protein KJ065_23475 [Anaerolineae bacterium]|nr:hypothetical protein [Anaerolineae bacterium]